MIEYTQEKAQVENKLCPRMTSSNVLGKNVIYCIEQMSCEGMGEAIYFDPCAWHETWYQIDECPLHFTRDEIKEKVEAFVEKKEKSK
jgi:hypothetical protein